MTNKKTRNEQRRRRRIARTMTVILLLGLLACGIALFSAAMAATPKPIEPEDYTLPVIEEDPRENERVESAVISAAYTAEAQIVVGYDWDYVTRVVMQEAGGNSEELQYAVCQAIQNRCEDTLLNPEEICRSCYTFPYQGEVSASVQKACERIFLLGEIYAPVRDADMLYNPSIDGPSADHERQIYICTIDGVRFFKERG